MSATKRAAPLPAPPAHDHAREHAHDHHHTHAPEAPGRAWLRAALWVALSALALWVLLRGDMTRYIAPNVAWTLWLAIIAALAMAALEGYVAWRRDDRLFAAVARLQRGGWRNLAPRSWSLSIIFVPVIAGILVTPAVLDAQSILANDGVVTLLPAPRHGSAMPSATPMQISLLQLHDRLQAGAPLSGATVRLTGFVFHRSDLPTGEWLLTRFITPHCVAEAQPIALVVNTGAIRAPPDDIWVTLTGTLASGTAMGHTQAVLTVTALQRIATPPDPYLIY